MSNDSDPHLSATDNDTASLRELIQPVLPPLRRYWRLVTLSICAGWGKFILPLAIPAITGAVIDLLLATELPLDQRLDQLGQYALITLAVLLGIGVATYFRSALAQRLTALVQYSLRKRLFRHIQYLSMGFFQRHHAGSLGSRVSSDINHAGVLINKGIIQWAMDAPLFIAIAAYMISIQPTLGAVTAGLCLICGMMMRRLGPPIRVQRRAIQESQSWVTGRAAEIFAGISVIKAFAGEPAARRRFADSSKRVRDLQWDNSHLQGRFQALNHSMVLMIQVVALFLGAWLILNGSGLTAGALVTCLMLINHIKGTVQRLTDSMLQIQDGFAACERISDILRVSPTPADQPGAVAPPLSGSLQFTNVAFGYNDTTVIEDFSFQFEAGKSYALVGASGSGKTTLTQLMLRFYDPRSGSVEVDGHNLRSIRSSHYRGHVAAVLQDPIIFSSTIADNIALADPDAPQAAIETAAR
ncbi:MAG: ABC transporter ATP-binding protein, partial [Planctomycetota bacterium]|nr:ABC transporter ATP-binding protein [Planctomycetota bacterium]